MEPDAYVPPAPARLRTDVFLTFAGKTTVLALGFAIVAVVARELGIPTVVQIKDLMASVRVGARLRVDGGAGLVEVLEP